MCPLCKFLSLISRPSRPFPDVLPLYKYPILTCPGKSIVVLHVTFPPDGSTPPHTHAGAFVSVNVTSGYVLNKMNNDPMIILGPGESFTESPKCRHIISDNASATEPATMVATFIVDTKVVDALGVNGLVIIDEDYRSLAVERKQKPPANIGGTS